MENLTISNNDAQNGGGIFAYSRTICQISNTTIKGNAATTRGGGIYANNGRYGTVNVEKNVIITENEAGESGGGVDFEDVGVFTFYNDNIKVLAKFDNNGNEITESIINDGNTIQVVKDNNGNPLTETNNNGKITYYYTKEDVYLEHKENENTYVLKIYNNTINQESNNKVKNGRNIYPRMTDKNVIDWTKDKSLNLKITCAKLLGTGSSGSQGMTIADKYYVIPGQISNKEIELSYKSKKTVEKTNYTIDITDYEIKFTNNESIKFSNIKIKTTNETETIKEVNIKDVQLSNTDDFSYDLNTNELNLYNNKENLIKIQMKDIDNDNKITIVNDKVKLSFINKETFNIDSVIRITDYKIIFTNDESIKFANIRIPNANGTSDTKEVNLKDVYVGHANDSTYNTDTKDLYICANKEYLIKIHIGDVKNNSYGEISKVTCDRYYGGIAYIGKELAGVDKNNKKIYVGKYVGLGDKIRFFKNEAKFDGNGVVTGVDDNKLIEYDYIDFSSNLTGQGMGYHNGRIYLTYTEGGNYQSIFNNKEKYSNLIYVINATSKEIEKTLYIPNTELKGGEIESVDFDEDGNIYANYNISINGIYAVRIYKLHEKQFWENLEDQIVKSEEDRIEITLENDLEVDRTITIPERKKCNINS